MSSFRYQLIFVFTDEKFNFPPVLCVQVEQVVNGIESIGLDKEEQNDGKQSRSSKAQKRRVRVCFQWHLDEFSHICHHFVKSQLLQYQICFGCKSKDQEQDLNLL